MNYKFTNPGRPDQPDRKWVAPGTTGKQQIGILFNKGTSTIIQGRREINAAIRAGLPYVIT